MKPLSEQTLYEILEIPADAPASEIERAYERARSLFAPDSLATYTLMAPDEAADLGRRIEEAKLVLLDPVARAGYDARLSSGTPPPYAGHTDDSTPPVAATAPPEFGMPATMATPEPVREVAATAPVQPPAPAQTPVPTPVLVAAAAPVAAPLPIAPPPEPVAAVEAAKPVPTPVPRAPEPARTSEPPAPFLADPPVWTGEWLRRAREARGLSVANLAERTRITRHHLANVEADAYGSLPAPVYLRGIIMSIARELRLDGQKVARSYLEAMTGAAAKNQIR